MLKIKKFSEEIDLKKKPYVILTLLCSLTFKICRSSIDVIKSCNYSLEYFCTYIYTFSAYAEKL